MTDWSRRREIWIACVRAGLSPHAVTCGVLARPAICAVSDRCKMCAYRLMCDVSCAMPDRADVHRLPPGEATARGTPHARLRQVAVWPEELRAEATGDGRACATMLEC